MAKSYPRYHAIIKLAFTLFDDASGQVSAFFVLAKLIWIIFAF